MPRKDDIKSRPTRGAWIEIGKLYVQEYTGTTVAPHTGRVD